MADAEKLVPGTWFITKTLFDGRVNHVMMNFTSDGGMVERFSLSPEGNVGVWEAADDDNDDDEDQFRFMAYRYNVVGAAFQHNDRLRATCQLTGNNTFSCTATSDQLDLNDNVKPNTTTGGFILTGTRLRVVPE